MIDEIAFRLPVAIKRMRRFQADDTRIELEMWFAMDWDRISRRCSRKPPN